MTSESASTTTGVGSTSALTIREIIPTNRTPEVWKDFNMCIMTNGQKKAQCKRSRIRIRKRGKRRWDGQIFTYNPDYLCEQFAGLVIQRGLPFNHFDHEQTTRVFQNTMQPRYTHVSRSTLKRDAMKLWVAAKQATINGFANLNTRVNLTTDVWSAPHNFPGSYMCVTAHWIEPSTWQMMKRVISFEEFLSPHTGTNLKYMLEKVFVIYGLQEKIMSITLDNASNNTSAMNKLRLKYNPPMAGRFYHSRCVAHIINLVVQAGLKVPIINQMKESFKQMLKDVFKSGDKIRKRYIRICRDADKPCYSPNWDVDTRWNSTFEMFESGLKQKTTLAYFHDILVNKNGRRFKKISEEYWVIIEMLNPLLEVFQNATVILSGVYYPTSPLKKLRKYFENMPPIITCSAALNPCFNVSGVDYLIENISRDLEFQDDGFATRTYQKKARNDPTMSSEYEQYLKADFVSHLHPKDFATFDVLGFWKAKENQFPVLSRMAMDILSVQASSVASESAFSTSGRLLTIRRTRLTPESLEMCMCLKDHLDAQERKQDTSPLELPLDVEEGVFNVEVQQNEATQLTDQEIALDASSDGSSGEPRHDYMMSSGAEDDQTGDGHDGSMSHASFLLVSAVALTVQVFLYSPISPDILELPPAVSSPPLYTPNNHLQAAIKLGDGILKKPEDVCFDQKGILYTATWDGAGDVIVCDTEEGLLKVNEDGELTALATHMNGANIRFADDVVEATDGTKPHGQLLKYDPSTKETSLVLDGLYFANGVTISSDQEFLVVCETWKLRCLKYWLKEEMRGKVDIFIDNLPGFPDNIKVAPDGSFWIAILQFTSSRLNFVHSSKVIKHLLALFPKLLEQVKVTDRRAMALNVGSDGTIIKRLDDPTGQVVAFVTSVLEFDGNLYLGTLKNDYIGKVPLRTAV
ncbi:zinc finger BED domain-containing protein RICESLEEPER 2-like protein [Tanacetum coccineum]